MDLGICGKWALVCGASKGLGLGCAEALAMEGVSVVLVARGEEALQAAADRLRHDARLPRGTEIVPVRADITTVEGRRLALASREAFDIVVTNAGGPPPGDFHQWARDDWIAALEANMLTPIELIKATIDGMQERGFGRIVNITSSAVKSPIATLGLSNGARSGLTGFVAGIARMHRYAGANVTVNNLLPGAFDTDRLRSSIAHTAMQGGGSVDDLTSARRRTIPSQRFGTPAEFGAACAFLCSAQAGYMTGQNLLVDGGAFTGTY